MKKLRILFIGILLLAMCMLTGCSIGNSNDDNESKKDDNEVVEENKTEEQATIPENSEVANFVTYDGNVYYWKLTTKSRESSALFAEYSYTTDQQNQLIKRAEDGTETVVTTAVGSGELCIANNKIYYQSLQNEKTNVCVMDIDGKNSKTLFIGELKCIAGDYIYAEQETSTNDPMINAIKIEDSSVKTVVSNGRIIGKADGNVFYIVDNRSKSVTFGYVEGELDHPSVAGFSSIEFADAEFVENVTFRKFEYKDNLVKIRLADIEGTGSFECNVSYLTMNKDGTNVTKTAEDIYEEGNSESAYESDLDADYSDNEIVYTDPDTKKEVTIVNETDLKNKFGFTIGEEDYVTVYICDRIGDTLYIVADNGTHNEAEDIGWRYSYRRLKTFAVKYDLKTSEISTIYEF